MKQSRKMMAERIKTARGGEIAAAFALVPLSLLGIRREWAQMKSLRSHRALEK